MRLQTYFDDGIYYSTFVLAVFSIRQDDVYINDVDYEIDGICFAHLPWSQAWTAWKDKKKTSRSKDSNGIKWSNFNEGKMNTNKGCSNMQHSNLYTFLHHKPLKIWVGWCIFHQPLGLGRCSGGFFVSPSVDRNPWRAFGNMVCSTPFAISLCILQSLNSKKTCWICWYENWMWQPWGYMKCTVPAYWRW